MKRRQIIYLLAFCLSLNTANFAFAQSLPFNDLRNSLQSPIAVPQTPPPLVSLAVTDLYLVQNQALPGETISGAFTIQNASNFDLYGVHYSFYLAQKSRVSKPPFLPKEFEPNPLSSYIPIIADYQASNESLNIGVLRSVRKEFSYTLPRNLPAGDYYFWVSAQLTRGDEFPSKEAALKILGNLEPFALSDPYFVSASTTNNQSPIGFLTYVAPIKSNEPININFSYHLKATLKDASIIPHVIIKKHSEVGEVVKEFDGDSLPLTQGDHSALVTLPNPGPGKYFTFIYFPGAVKITAATKPKSVPAGVILPKYLPFIARFYFDVEGEQAEIQNMIIAKNGGAINIQGLILGLLHDVKNALGDASLTLKTTDLQTGGETSQSQNVTLPLQNNFYPFLALFNLNSSPLYPKFTIRIAKNGNLLDEYSVSPNGNPPANTINNQPTGLSPQTILAIIGVIILIIILAIYVALRKESQNTTVNP